MSEDDYTPPGTSRRSSTDYRGDLLTGTSPPLRQVANKMNAAAVTLVQYSTSLFVFVGVGCVVWALCDSFLHHVIGHWPEPPEVAELRKLEKEHEQTVQELARVRGAWIQCLDGDGDASGGEAQ